MSTDEILKAIAESIEDPNASYDEKLSKLATIYEYVHFKFQLMCMDEQDREQYSAAVLRGEALEWIRYFKGLRDKPAYVNLNQKKSMITKVTLTGADDSTSIDELFEITQEFPFVEWGILVSKKHFGGYRFPSYGWIEELCKAKAAKNPDMKLSCHLCGEYVRELVKGNDMALKELGGLIYSFERIQLNFHAIPHKFMDSLIGIMSVLKNHEFIFQYDGVNDDHVRGLLGKVGNFSVLFDRSGGAGVLPETWPVPLPGISCGYAGGLSPENVGGQIDILEVRVGETPIWIDAETHVRSKGDSVFDLDKVRRFLEVCKPHVVDLP